MGHPAEQAAINSVIMGKSLLLVHAFAGSVQGHACLVHVLHSMTLHQYSLRKFQAVWLIGQAAWQWEAQWTVQ